MGGMTTTASVPAAPPTETGFAFIPTDASLLEVQPRTVPEPPDQRLACVILSAAPTPQPSEIAQRIAAILAPLAVDITGLDETEALPRLHAGHAVFLVSSTGWPCLERARERAGWLRRHGLEDRCGLVLWHVPGGATAGEAEDFTGMPVCALMDCDEHLQRFAGWIIAEHRRLAAC